MNVFYIYLTVLVFATSIPQYLAACSEEKAFVDGHNSRRLQIAQGKVRNQPAASDMKMMVWDKELQAKATAWAKADQGKHNPDRSIPSGRFSTGENLYWYYTTDRRYKLNVDNAMASWFNEHANYTYGPLKASDFDGSKKYQIGHYTQMVWSDTIYVGCGVNQKFEGQWNKFYVVCNYGPAGNYLGETPYTKGSGSYNLQCGCSSNDYNCNCNKPYGSNC